MIGLYQGKGTRNDDAQERLVSLQKLPRERPQDYRPDDGLRDAANAALLLGQPLLLTGEPGTGKTRFAEALAWELGLGKPLGFEAKSTSTARDLFYRYDALSHYQSIHVSKLAGEAGGAKTGLAAEMDTGVLRPKAVGANDFIRFEALGRAILYANEPDSVRRYLPEDELHTSARRSVVLIDEIDKAPRDLPNDILAELEDLFFRVPELDNAAIGIPNANRNRPVVVITSNSEKNLPSAFLRRCVFYDIPFPKPDRLEEIVTARLNPPKVADVPVADVGKPFSTDFVTTAVQLFGLLRTDTSVRRSPATAELLSWLRALRRMLPNSANPLKDQPALAMSTLGLLIKTRHDRPHAERIVRTWMTSKPGAP